MTLHKIAKSIARRTGEDVEEVYQRFIENRRKLRRMEGKVYVKDYTKKSEYYYPQPLVKHKRFSKT